MQQFNFPTVMLYGEGALKESASRMKDLGFKKPLLVTDKTLVELKIVDQVLEELQIVGIEAVVYDGTHPNPVEDDCIEGANLYKDNKCDSLIAVGGGSPMDAAKGIMVLATHDGPLAKYDDAKGGDKYITNTLPPLVAIPTTAGTGSEVGRSGVIIIKATNDKTIIFHPTMMPVLAVLEPTLTTGLPKHITAATGIDAFTHALEAYFAPGFHPMADGIALEGMKLVLDNLATACKDGKNIEARSKMLLAASMGATAFQKGLGMIHSIAHPLSSECGLHHGLANALALPASVAFLESSDLNDEQRSRIHTVLTLFKNRGMDKKTLAETCSSWFMELGVTMGLSNHGVKPEQVDKLSSKAFDDVCHGTNMIPVTTDDFKAVIQNSL
jgi:4-hydroxybutyrate dehydrogenase